MAVVVGAYVIAAKLGLELAFAHENVSPVWPASGVAFVALLYGGIRLWPAIAVAAFLSNHFLTGAGLLVSLGIAAGNTAEAVCGVWLARRFVGPVLLTPTSHFFKFLGVLVASSAVAATWGNLVLAVGGASRWSEFPFLWVTWWLGDVIGALLLVPLFVTWPSFRAIRWSRANIAGGAALTVALLGIALLTFGGWLPKHTRALDVTLAQASMPLLVWAALQFRQPGVSLALVILSTISDWGTVRGFGPFARGTASESMLLLELYLVCIAVTGHTLAAVVTELAGALRQLRSSNEELKRSVEDLGASNRELGELAYAASHDLKEPLRMITLYLQLLRRRHGGQLGGDADTYIGYAVEGASRMYRLIEGLLEYSRIGGRGESPEIVDTNAVLEAVRHNLTLAITEAGAELVAEPLPPLPIRSVELTQLFQNLVANAIKFHGAETPRIRVSAVELDGEWRFSVEDNGIGIPPEGRERIFGMFQRLHTADSYPGTGIGLALCRKIVERHGGRLWVESELGKGSLFRFTIPVGKRSVFNRLPDSSKKMPAGTS